MAKVKIISVGKTKEAWLEMAIDEYRKRLSRDLQIEFLFAKDDGALLRLVEKEKQLFCLDVKGKVLDSEEFSRLLMRELEEGGAKVAIVIGGAEGLPAEMAKKHRLVSLSRMTFTHQCTRLILVEQIYRAVQITKGTKYHK